MRITIEDYLMHNERITPIQYVKAGQVIKSLTIFISCKEHLNKFADIVDYSVDRYSPDGCASVIAKFKKDPKGFIKKKVIDATARFAEGGVI